LFFFIGQDLQDILDVYLFGFPDESQKTQFAFGKNILFFQRLWLHRFGLVSRTGHQNAKFPALFGGIVLDYFHPESDPEKNLVNPVDPVYSK
jgi:hypothetical protein